MKGMILVACCFAAVAQVHAADTARVMQEVVYIGDLRLETARGLETVYSRVQAAANRVCQPLEYRDRMNDAYSKCKQLAVDNATAQIPALANYDPKTHKIRNG
jgi:UrcA family protein